MADNRKLLVDGYSAKPAVTRTDPPHQRGYQATGAATVPSAPPKAFPKTVSAVQVPTRTNG